MKREDWNGEEKRKSRVSCIQARREGRFRTGLWSTAGANGTHLINQSMDEPSRKNSSLPKNVTWNWIFTKSRCLHWITQDRRLNQPRFCSSELNFERKGTGSKSLKMSHFDLRGLKAIPDLPSTIFFYTSTAFDYFFFYLILIIYPPAILLCPQNWEKTRREWQFWLRREVDDGVRATLRFLSKVEFFSFLPALVQPVQRRIQLLQ